MLKILRHKPTQRKIFIGIGIVVLPSFLIWAAVIDKSESGRSPFAGAINGKKISTGDFLGSLQSLRREIFLMHGERSEQLLRSVDLEKATWDRILLLEEARRLRVRVSNAEVIDWISKQPIFKPSGYFEPAVYKRFVQYQLKLTPRDFEEDMRKFLTLRKTVDALSPSTNLTEDDAKRVYLERTAARNLRYVLITEAPGAEEKPVTDQDVKQIYDIVQGNLTTPERLKLSYVVLAKGASDTPEARKEIEEGGLEKAAEKGLAVKTSGFITGQDPLPDVGFSAALSQALRNLKEKGDLTGWVETDKGAVLARLDEKEESRKLTYDEAKEEIQKKITESRRVEAVRGKADKIRAAMAEKSFEAVAAEEKLTILEAKNHKPGDYLDKVGVIAGVGRVIVPVKAGEISQPVPFPGGLVLVRVDSIDETIGGDWAEIKGRILEELTDTARSEALSKKMQEMWSGLKPNFKTMGAIFPEKYASGLSNPLTASSVPDAAPEPAPETKPGASDE